MKNWKKTKTWEYRNEEVIKNVIMRTLKIEWIK